ncbi:cobalt transporter CbiM [Marinobacterium jannaschii]|uniref:cobalt transporter CbiM n=1 Tax=Marinobacterium jannaschii TaxID=64970 RepID=UPI000480FE2B|nr:cobalt transporter CbiM [Marinobacterium jannaschii]
MHIVDGALANEVVIAGALLSAAGVAIGLKKMDMDRLPQTGILSAVFFIASLVHVPVGFSSVHLILNGLIGIALGWAAFPALLIALLLQAVFFGFGGLLVLGVNTFNIALPALLVYLICGHGVRHLNPKVAALWGAAAGALAIAFTALLVGASLALSGEGFITAAKLAFASHIPVMLLEGFLTGATVLLLSKVKPEILGVSGDRA